MSVVSTTYLEYAADRSTFDEMVTGAKAAWHTNMAARKLTPVRVRGVEIQHLRPPVVTVHGEVEEKNATPATPARRRTAKEKALMEDITFMFDTGEHPALIAARLGVDAARLAKVCRANRKSAWAVQFEEEAA